MKWIPAAGPLAVEVDTEMKQATRIKENLADSKHEVKEMSEEEINEMAKERGLEKERTEEKDKAIEEEESEGRSHLFSSS